MKPLLVVEDTEEDFIFLRKVLSKLAVTQPIYRCFDGEEALDFLYHRNNYLNSAIAPRPAIILLDLNLPKTNGKEFLQIVKGDPQLKTIPVIVFTTSSEPKDIDDCYKYGANSYLHKSSVFSDLTKNIEAFVGYWLDVCPLPHYY